MFGGVGAWMGHGPMLVRREMSKVFLEDCDSWQS